MMNENRNISSKNSNRFMAISEAVRISIAYRHMFGLVELLIMRNIFV